MTTEISNQILRILGERPLSWLPLTSNTVDGGDYLFYDTAEPVAARHVFTKTGHNLVDYLCRQVYAFLFRRSGVRFAPCVSGEQLTILTNEIGNGQETVVVSFQIASDAASGQPDVQMMLSNVQGYTDAVEVGRGKRYMDGTVHLVSFATDATIQAAMQKAFVLQDKPVVARYQAFRSIYPEAFLTRTSQTADGMTTTIDLTTRPFEMNRYVFSKGIRKEGETTITYGDDWIGKPTPTASEGNTNLTDVWFKHFQYFYFSNLTTAPRTMLIKYLRTDKIPAKASWGIQPSMWDSELTTTAMVQLPWHPFNVDSAKASKRLYIPPAALKESKFRRSSYYKIVHGDWDVSNYAYDYNWAVEGCHAYKSGNTWIKELPPEPNNFDSDNQPTGTNLGDIDQTLKSLEEFIDDTIAITEPTPHHGKVMMTAFRDLTSVNDGKAEQFPFDTSKWRNVLAYTTSTVRRAFLVAHNTESVSTWKEPTNDITLKQYPQHNHNTVPSGNLHNVSFIGRPEGESVGGFAVTNTAEYWSPENKKIPYVTIVNDEAQTRPTNQTVNPLTLSSGKVGPYTGSVMYDSSSITAAVTSHNNMPLYYKIRCFVYMPDKAPKPPISALAIYRLYSSARVNHFYTISATERDNAVQTLEYKFEGEAFKAFATQASGSSPVYRFYHSTNLDHFYTISASEAAQVRQTAGWKDEGIAFYAYADKRSGTTPVYRFHNSSYSDHFYTADKTEHDSLAAQTGWKDEGVAFYAPT